MNLLLSSDIDSLEIGYATDTWTEYNELLGFYHRYIHIGEPFHCGPTAGRPAADLKNIMRSLREELKKTKKSSWLWLAENALQIFTGRNNYSVSINEGCLRITVCLRFDCATTQKSVQYSSWFVKKIRDLTTMKVDMHPDSKPDILQLTGQAQHTLKSTCINEILEAEAAYMMLSVKRFIDAIDDLVLPVKSGVGVRMTKTGKVIP